MSFIWIKPQNIPSIPGLLLRTFVTQKGVVTVYERDGSSHGDYLSEIIDAFNFPATIYTSTCKGIHNNIAERVSLARSVICNLTQ